MKVIDHLIQAGYNMPKGAIEIIKSHFNKQKYIVLYDSYSTGLYYGATNGRMPPKEGILNSTRITIFSSKASAKGAIVNTCDFYSGNSGLNNKDHYEIKKVTEI